MLSRNHWFLVGFLSSCLEKRHCYTLYILSCKFFEHLHSIIILSIFKTSLLWHVTWPHSTKLSEYWINITNTCLHSWLLMETDLATSCFTRCCFHIAQSSSLLMMKVQETTTRWHSSRGTERRQGLYFSDHYKMISCALCRIDFCCKITRAYSHHG